MKAQKKAQQFIQAIEDKNLIEISSLLEDYEFDTIKYEIKELIKYKINLNSVRKIVQEEFLKKYDFEVDEDFLYEEYKENKLLSEVENE